MQTFKEKINFYFVLKFYIQTAVSKETLKEHGKIVEMLLENGASVDVRSWGYQTIHFATFGGHLYVVKLIANKHPEVLNAKTKYGDETPLDIARRKGHKHIKNLLVNEMN